MLPRILLLMLLVTFIRILILILKLLLVLILLRSVIEIRIKDNDNEIDKANTHNSSAKGITTSRSNEHDDLNQYQQLLIIIPKVISIHIVNLISAISMMLRIRTTI